MKLNEEGECEEMCDVKTLCPVCEKEFNEGDEKPNDELRELICGEKVFYCDECEGDESKRSSSTKDKRAAKIKNSPHKTPTAI